MITGPGGEPGIGGKIGVAGAISACAEVEACKEVVDPAAGGPWPRVGLEDPFNEVMPRSKERLGM